MTEPRDSPLDKLRTAMRRRERFEQWRGLYEQSLEATYRGGDVRGSAELAMMAAASLAAEGRSREAINEIEFASRLSKDVPEARVSLRCMRAALEAVAGDIAAAAVTLDQVEQDDLDDVPAGVRLEYTTYRSMVACIAIEPADLDTMAQPMVGTAKDGRDWFSTGLAIWLIPWLAAVGRLREAGPWITALQAQVTATGGEWRKEDAAVFAHLAVIPGNSAAPDIALHRSPNTYTAWRSRVADAYLAVVRTNWLEASELVASLDSLAGSVNPTVRSGALAFQSSIAACQGVSTSKAGGPPATLSLVTLAPTLALAESVALHGSQDEAVRWQRWFDESFPCHIKTSIEWPVAAERVRGLLAARTGDITAGIRWLSSAIEWADAAGYAIESAITRVQLAELQVISPRSTSADDWTASRSAARNLCAELGIDYAAPAYRASSAAGMGRLTVERPSLTPREAEVLAVLAEGLTYRETADRLGIAWRTVQSHAHHAYEKLDASGKVRAIAAARRLGILSDPLDDGRARGAPAG